MFYTYIHTRASDNKPFYVGKGSKNRSHSTEARNPYWHKTVAKHGIKIDIAAKWQTEKEAFIHEEFLIQCFTDMGFPLVNLTTGGEGGSHCAETRAKLSLLSKGRKHPPRSTEWRRSLSIANKGQVVTPAQREKLRVAGLKRKHSDETRRRMSESAKKAITPAHCVERSVRQFGGLNHSAKAVVCLDTKIVYPSAADAARDMRLRGNLKAAKSAISACCLGKMRTAYKHTWAFAKEGENEGIVNIQTSHVD